MNHHVNHYHRPATSTNIDFSFLAFARDKADELNPLVSTNNEPSPNGFVQLAYSNNGSQSFCHVNATTDDMAQAVVQQLQNDPNFAAFFHSVIEKMELLLLRQAQQKLSATQPHKKQNNK